MKTTFRYVVIAVLLLHVFQADSAHAQVGPDSLKAAVPYSLFPIGAIRYSRFDTLERMLAMNFGYSFAGIRESSRNKEVSPPLDASATVVDKFYYDTTATKYINAKTIVLEAASAHEVRSYLPGTAGILKDYVVGWGSKAGDIWRDNINPSIVIDPAQWRIKPTDSIDINNYVLRDLGSLASTDIYYSFGHYEGGANPDHVGSASYEFVFFIDTSSFTLNHDLPLYQLEYWVKEQGSSTWNIVDSQAITYNTYKNLGVTNSTVVGHTGNGDRLSDWGTKPVNHPYKTLKKNLNIRPYYHGSYFQQTDSRNLTIDVRLKSFRKWDIFPRLLRIRDWRGQRLLTGSADAEIKSAINSLKSADTSSNLAGWVLGDEPYPQHFRAWAYVNELIQIQGGKLPTVLSPAYHDQFIRTLRDQLGTSRFPGPTWYDSYPFGGSSGRLYSLSGGTPSYYWNISGTPIPVDAAPDSAKQYKRGFRVFSDYAAYTHEIQDNIIGFCGTDGTNRGWTSDFNNIATASYLDDPKAKIPYYAMLQSYLRRSRSLPWRVDSLTIALYGLSDATLARRLVFADSIHYTNVVLPYLNWAFNNGKKDSLAEDSLYDINWDIRAMTEPELYYQLWSSIIFGVKGIAYSTATDDDIEQVGIISDDPKNDTRSSDRTHIKLTEYMHGLETGLGFLTPFSQDSSLKWHVFHSKCNAGVLDSFTYRYSDQNENIDKDRFPHCPYDFSSCDSIAWATHVSYSNWKRTTSNVPLAGAAAHIKCDGALEMYGDGVIRYAPVPPLYAPMFNIVRMMITQDLNPIAPTLAQLNWLGAISWHKRLSSPNALSVLPIKNVIAKQLMASPFYGAKDADTVTYVDIGIFRKPTDSAAFYVGLLNRRLWIDTSTSGAKGKIDYRTISFQVDSTKFPTPYSHYSYWRISDVAGILRDTVMNTKDTFFFTVKPGQGKLFRVAPAIGLTLGQMATNTFNNARHIASVESDTGVTRFLTTYQRGGNIVVSFPVETPTGASKRILDNPSDTVINSSGKCSTPAIAYSRPRKRIGVIYAKTKLDTYGNHYDTVEVYNTQSQLATPYAFSAHVRLDSFVVLNAGGASDHFEAAPAIVPGNDSLRLFWVSWRHPINGGQLTVVDSTCTAKYSPPAIVRKYVGGTPKFISLATYKNSDTVHIAWEESVSGATDIYYTNAVAGKGVIVVSPPKIISQLIGNTDCDEYHFPQITVTKNGTASVVWEGLPQKVEKTGYNIFKHYL
ncbi:MAG: hypothetical protein ABI444_00750 [Candidatus Kapaibacterium sp.]